MNKRKCRNCGLEQSVDKFPKARVIRGKTYHRYLCSKCFVEQKTNYKHTQKFQLDEYKKTQKCSKCGNDDYRVIDFHHKDRGTKTENIANMVVKGSSFQTIIKEIMGKCIPLCSNCHRILHYEEKRDMGKFS